MVSDWSAWSWYNLHVSILRRKPLIKLLHSAWSLKLSGENKNSCALLLHDEGQSFKFLYAFSHFFINLQRRSRISHIYAGLNLANGVKVFFEKQLYFPRKLSKTWDETLQRFQIVWRIVSEVCVGLPCTFLGLRFKWLMTTWSRITWN